MALPKIATKTYQTTLPHSGQEVEYRPYLVKEERALLMANQSEDEGEMLLAIFNMIDACVLTEGFDSKELINADMEWIFVHVRSKSVSEVVKFNQKCSECEKDFEVEFNLENIKLKTDPNHTTRYEIPEHNMGINFILPTSKTVMSMSNINTESPEQIFEFIESCVYEVWDNETVYRIGVDFQIDEVAGFFDQLKSSHIQKIYETVFETAPKLVQELHTKCSHCSHEGIYEVEGILSFFG